MLIRRNINILLIMLFTLPLFAGDSEFTNLLKQDDDGNYNKHGWNHYGPGFFTLDEKSGELQSHKGMGLFWYAEKKFRNFVLELEFKTQLDRSNSGIFVRVADVPTSDAYIHEAFEIQICAACDKDNNVTGAIYDAKGPDVPVKLEKSGKWNQYRITCIDDSIWVDVNGERVNTWKIETPIGKIKTWHTEGYIGLQNHDADNSTWFRNIRIKELD